MGYAVPRAEIIPPGARLLWAPQPGPQEALLACPIEDVLYGGARGGGKTEALLGDWMSHADMYGRDARGVMIRRTYPELEEIERRAEELFRPLGAKWFAVRRLWHWPNGATLKLRYMERDADASRYQGHQYTWIGIDEMTQWPTPYPIDQLRACLRSAAGVPCYFRATANPGGPGHNWVKSRYIDPAPAYVPHRDPKTHVLRVYIPAKLEDNPALTDKDPDYWRRIEAAASGNEALLKAWRYGSWDIVAGGMFDDLWDESVHFVSPFSIPLSWTIDRSLDWGSARPFSVGWWAESDGTAAPNGRVYPRGTLIRIAELYGCQPGRPNEGVQWSPDRVAQEILHMERDLGIAGRVHPGPADTQIFQTQASMQSIADVMAEHGVRWVAANQAPGSRATRWQMMRRLLAAARDGATDCPWLLVFDRCADFRRTIPVLLRSSRNPEDIDTDAEDHIADEAGYRVLARRGIARNVRITGVYARAV